MFGNVVKRPWCDKGNYRDVLPALMLWQENKGAFSGEVFVPFNLETIKERERYSAKGPDNPT